MAAHYPPALMLSQSGDANMIALHWINDMLSAKPLGCPFPDAVYTSDQVKFPMGSTPLVFSDGVMDCLAPTDFDEKEAALQNLAVSLAEPVKLWSRLCESLKNSTM